MASDPPPPHQTTIPLPPASGDQPLHFVHRTRVPIPPAAVTEVGGDLPDDTDQSSLVPIHIVDDASQLPHEFLNPSAEKKLVIGFDCEGVDLCRNGALCVMQLAFPDAVYLVDAIKGGEALVQACKPALESSYITKVIHDCKRDSEALYFQFGIKLHNVMDTQIAYSLIEEHEGKKRAPDDYISFVGLLADPRYCGVSYLEKQTVRVLLREDPKFWTYRPMTEMMIRAATDDVRFLLYIYHKLMEKLNEKSLWHLSVRGSLYCRCFCINDNDYADWPPLPSLPESLVAEGYVPIEEILSVLHVPPGKMGRIIGRGGASITSVKECCYCEILIGGSKGPPDKVFIIGPVKEVRKAEAILRGKMLYI
ncbi:putative 3'-5' exonuclease domain, K domain, ribonuclease H-like superfamily [Dioscorea sansibarensis]